jgi:type IV pilus assembly protein PilE
MDKLMKKRETGFTLIELMITAVIVGILAAVAIPSFNSYVIKGKRSQAKAALLNLSQMEERYYTNNYGYKAVTAAPGVDPWPNFAGTNVGARTYDIAVTLPVVVPASSVYIITATPSNGFTDTQCGTLLLDNTGAKRSNAIVNGTVNGTVGAAPCW